MPITVNNLTPTRTFDADSVSIDVLADVIGTLIEDWEDGSFDVADWTFLNDTIDRSARADEITIDELSDVFATLVEDNPKVAFRGVITHFTVVTTLDCNSTSPTELANVFATFISQHRGPSSAESIEWTLPANRLHYNLPANRLHYTIPQ